MLSFFGLPSLALVSLAAGFASPRGFWLWGFSANLLPRAADVLLPFYLDRRFENFRDKAGAPGDDLWFSLAFATPTFAIFGVFHADGTTAKLVGISSGPRKWRGGRDR